MSGSVSNSFLVSVAMVLLFSGCATSSHDPDVEAKLLAEKQVAAQEKVQTEAKIIAAVDDENNIFFELGSAEIDGVGLLKLKRHAERLKADKKLRLKLIGHADYLGSPSYNLAISEKRATAAYKVLRSLYVSRTQLRRSSLGSEMNSKSCQSPECRALMRRVELQYVN